MSLSWDGLEPRGSRNGWNRSLMASLSLNFEDASIPTDDDMMIRPH